MSSPVTRYHFPRRELWPVGFHEPVSTWPVCTTTGVSRSISARFLQPLQHGLSNDGDRANLDNEKGLNVVKLQVVKAHWPYAFCTMLHTSDRTSGRVHTCGTPGPLDRSVDLNNLLRI